MTTVAKGRPRDAAVRIAAIEAARSLLMTLGYDGVTMRDVAITAGISRPSLYRRWPTKQMLVADCVLDDVESLGLILVDASGDLRTDLVSWIEQSTERIRERDAAALFRALLAAAASDDAASRQMNTQLLTPLRESVRAACRHAGRQDDEVIADAMIGGMVNALVTRDPAALTRLTVLAATLAGA